MNFDNENENNVNLNEAVQPTTGMVLDETQSVSLLDDLNPASNEAMKKVVDALKKAGFTIVKSDSSFSYPIIMMARHNETKTVWQGISIAFYNGSELGHREYQINDRVVSIPHTAKDIAGDAGWLDYCKSQLRRQKNGDLLTVDSTVIRVDNINEETIDQWVTVTTAQLVDQWKGVFEVLLGTNTSVTLNKHINMNVAPPAHSQMYDTMGNLLIPDIQIRGNVVTQPNMNKNSVHAGGAGRAAFQVVGSLDVLPVKIPTPTPQQGFPGSQTQAIFHQMGVSDMLSPVLKISGVTSRYTNNLMMLLQILSITASLPVSNYAKATTAQKSRNQANGNLTDVFTVIPALDPAGNGGFIQGRVQDIEPDQFSDVAEVMISDNFTLEVTPSLSGTAPAWSLPARVAEIPVMGCTIDPLQANKVVYEKVQQMTGGLLSEYVGAGDMLFRRSGVEVKGHYQTSTGGIRSLSEIDYLTGIHLIQEAQLGSGELAVWHQAMTGNSVDVNLLGAWLNLYEALKVNPKFTGLAYRIQIHPGLLKAIAQWLRTQLTLDLTVDPSMALRNQQSQTYLYNQQPIAMMGQGWLNPVSMQNQNNGFYNFY